MINQRFQDTIGFIALIVLFFSQAGMFFKLEPFYTWFYLFAWWSYIIFIDSILYKIKGNSLIRSRGKEILILSAWSVIFWFIFETVNFSLKNWYYINLPVDNFLRISGIILAFATVLPGFFLTCELLEISNVYKSISIIRFRFNNYVLWILFLTGVLFAVLSVRYPKIFFPLIWGSFTLTLEPILYWFGGRSLLKDLENGNPSKVLILLTSGLICGFLWEFWNYWAYSKWVYTIPYWNTGKIFEMPVAGFLGFPPFAIDCYVMYNLVCLFRKDSGWERNPHPVSYPLPKPFTTFILPLIMIAFSFTVIKNMEKYTIGSYQSSVKDIPAVSEEDHAYLVNKGVRRIQKFIKLCANPKNLKKISKDLNRPLKTVHKWCDYALLIDFQGIGAVNLLVLKKAGIESILDLAKTNPEILLEKFKNTPPARVKLWIKEAKKLK
tara:strand:+ start:1430 stop:2740 length:1311 start_codon:yes stop_codon:yes gene_type:complete